MAFQDFGQGLVTFRLNNEVYNVVGNIEYQLGVMKNEPIMGATRLNGFSAKPNVPGMKLSITDWKGCDQRKLMTMVGGTAIAQKRNGKSVILRDATYGGDGTGNTETGEVPLELFGSSCEEVAA